MTLYRYRMSPERKDRVEVVLGPQDEFPVSVQRTRVQDRLPARSLTVYSTYHLQPGDPGIMAE
ncbi:MAG: hypothetical protein ABSG54_06280 [Terriglobia bacterium]|jgi:hypothetical protein